MSRVIFFALFIKIKTGETGCIFCPLIAMILDEFNLQKKILLNSRIVEWVN